MIIPRLAWEKKESYIKIALYWGLDFNYTTLYHIPGMFQKWPDRFIQMVLNYKLTPNQAASFLSNENTYLYPKVVKKCMLAVDYCIINKKDQIDIIKDALYFVPQSDRYTRHYLRDLLKELETDK